MIDHILSLGDASASEKATILSSVTRADIKLADLENYLSEQSLAWRDEITGNWVGPLVDAMQAGGALGEGLAELFRHMNKIRSIHILSNEPEWGLKCKSLVDGLVLAGVITDLQAEEVLALGGGRAYGDVTEAEVLAAIQVHEDKLAAQAVAQAEAQAQREAAEALFMKKAEARLLMEELHALINTHVAPLADGLEPNTDRAAWAAAIDAIRSNWSV